jgi:fluoride exporter
MNLYKLLAVGLGGSVGSISRYVISRAVDKRLELLVPYGTLVVNVVGSFILGLVFSLTLKGTDDREIWRLLLGVGFCGGFTTFSSFALENFLLLQQKQAGEFILYTTFSFALCLGGVALGVWLGNKAW